VRREPLIIGAGPAGSAAAIRLGQAGYHPLLVERSRGPTDKVCGDFLGADAIERLAGLGVELATLGAVPIRHLRLVHSDRMTQIELPFRAVGLSRRVLDEALLRRAEAAGSRLQLGRTVRRIGRGKDGWRVDTGDSHPIDVSEVFLATGKHDLRALPRPGVAQGAVGLKMYFRLSPTQTVALAGLIVLILFPGGYAGLQCVEAGRAVLCVAVGRKRFHALGGTWSGMLDSLISATPPMREMLNGAEPLLSRPLAVAGVPYGYLHRHSPAANQQGLFRLGDQAAVIPSLTGDGIAIALHSGTLAAQCWLDGRGAAAYHRCLAHDIGGQMRLARWLHTAGMTGSLQAAAIRGTEWLPGLLHRAARGTRLKTCLGTEAGRG
jgi:flavin-dependent dehydrogenase